MAMARIAIRLQPTKGSQSSSFFTIQDCGGKRLSMKRVSHADWCLAMITTGESGTFSQPRTSWRMPRHQRTPCIMTVA